MTSARRHQLIIALISACCVFILGFLAPLSRGIPSEVARANELRGTISYSPIIVGYNRFLRDFYFHFWDRSNSIPRIRPTEGYGYVNNKLNQYTYWQMAEAANILYWEYKVSRSPDIRVLFQSQWNEVRSMYTAEELSSADPALNRHTINVSDDAAVSLQYLIRSMN